MWERGIIHNKLFLKCKEDPFEDFCRHGCSDPILFQWTVFAKEICIDIFVVVTMMMERQIEDDLQKKM